MGICESKLVNLEQALQVDVKNIRMCCVPERKDDVINTTECKRGIDAVHKPVFFDTIQCKKEVRFEETTDEVRFEVPANEWTSAQLTQLKDEVRRTASKMQCKCPGFFALHRYLDACCLIRSLFSI
jgi:hypothetical protein